MLAKASLSSHYCCHLSIDVLVGEALYVPDLTALVARGGVFKISCEGDQLGSFGLQLCTGCGGGYVWTSLRTSTVRKYAVRARGLGMVACLVCGAVQSRAVLSAAGCAVYVDIETCAPHLTRVCVRYGVRHMQRMAVCLMCGADRTRATCRGGECGKSL